VSNLDQNIMMNFKMLAVVFFGNNFTAEFWMCAVNPGVAIHVPKTGSQYYPQKCSYYIVMSKPFFGQPSKLVLFCRLEMIRSVV
jgi:hypothetical protein